MDTKHTPSTFRTRLSRGLGRAALVLCLAAMSVTLTSCAQKGDPKYVRGGKQYGITRGLFRSRWWNFYERGLSYLDGGFYGEAERDFRKALNLRGKDQRRARTYGLHFTDFFPHRDLGVALLKTGKVSEGLQELQVSMRQSPSAKAKFYLNEARATMLAQTNQDRENPKVAITSIKDGTITNKFVLDVRGKATDDTFVKWVRINGRKQFIELAEPSKTFSRKLILKPGVNRINVAAGDLLNKQGEQTITVVLDREGPLFTLQSPEDEALVRQPELRLAGTFSDSTGVVEVKLNGEPYAIAPGARVRIDRMIALTPGPNTITIEARDRVGNVTTGQLTVTYNQKAEGEWLKKAELPPRHRRAWQLVRLAALDVFSDAVRPILTAARRSPVLQLLPVAAKPDTKPPKITIKGLKSKQNSIDVYSENLFIDGKVKDKSGVASLEIDDEDKLEEEGKTVFFNYLVELEEGENEVAIVAEDEAGNQATRTLKVTRKVPSVEQVGSRFTLAVLPFQIKQESDVSETLDDIFQQKLLDLERFNLVSRDNEAYEAALRELKLSQTQLVNKSAAVKVGRIVQAEGIVSGKARETDDSLEIYARLIDTETSQILVGHDVYGTEKTLDSIDFLMNGLALKFQRTFPLLEGLVIKISGDDVTLDLGREHQVKRQMRFIIFRDGQPLKHPLSGKVMAGEPLELGLLRITKVLKESLVGKFSRLKADLALKQLDKAIAK